MKIGQVKNMYFLGIGGIGMSALARYFNQLGVNVSGYDKTPTALTEQLQAEGIDIHFEDNPNLISADVDGEYAMHLQNIQSYRQRYGI